jgi:hypothetical protein
MSENGVKEKKKNRESENKKEVGMFTGGVTTVLVVATVEVEADGVGVGVSVGDGDDTDTVLGFDFG